MRHCCQIQTQVLVFKRSPIPPVSIQGTSSPLSINVVGRVWTEQQHRNPSQHKLSFIMIAIWSMRILALHGAQQNADLFSERIASLEKAISASVVIVLISWFSRVGVRAWCYGVRLYLYYESYLWKSQLSKQNRKGADAFLITTPKIRSFRTWRTMTYISPACVPISNDIPV